MQKQKKHLLRVLLFFSTVFYLTVVNIQVAFGQWNKSSYSMTGLPSTALATVIQNVALWLLGIFGFIAIIGFVISGITYLVSAGDEDLQEKAKRAMLYSITGVIVGLIGLVVIYTVDSLLRGGSNSLLNGLLTLK